MPVPTARTDLSIIASNNSPQGSDTIGTSTGPDDYLRAHAALIRANYDDIVTRQTETVSVKDYGAVGDGVADDTDAIGAVHAYVTGLDNPPTVVFPAGIYKYSESPNWAMTNLRVVSTGVVRLRCTGTGNGFVLDAGASGNVFNMEVGPFILEPADTCTNGWYLRGVHHSDIRLLSRGSGSGYAGGRIEFSVCNRYWVTTSVNEDAGWYSSAAPTYGVYVTRRGSGAERASYNTFYCPIMEGVGTGIYLDHADSNVFFGGTSEGCTSRGVEETANCGNNRFDSMDLEQNTTEDAFCSGVSTSFYSTDSNTIIRLNGSTQQIFGGRQNSITVDTSAVSAQLIGCRINRNGTGSITDNGTNTTISYVVDQATGLPVQDYVSGKVAALPSNRAANQSVVTITASPQTITNNTAYLNDYYIVGGTVNYVEISRNGSFSMCAYGGGHFTLSPGDAMKVTYAVAPDQITAYPR
jgi:hypothetical protein